MKIFGLVLFFASSFAAGRSLDDVIAKYSTIEKISPVELKGLPVMPDDAKAVCRLAGYDLVLDVEVLENSIKGGSIYVFISDFYKIAQIETRLSSGKAPSLKSVTCAKQ